MAEVQLFDVATFDYDKLAAPIASLAFNSYATVGAPNADQMEVRTVITPVAGVYVFGISMSYTVEGASTGVIDYRFTFDGGTNWNNYTQETTANDETEGVEYLFPYVHGGGALDLVFQATRQNGAISVEFADIWFDRKGNTSAGGALFFSDSYIDANTSSDTITTDSDA